MSETAPGVGKGEFARLSLLARVYFTLIVLLGAALLVTRLLEWECHDYPRFLVYLAISIVSSLFKVRLPSIRGTMSVNFLFFLVAIIELSLSETLAIGFLSTVAQCVWRAKSRLTSLKALFNVAVIGIALGTAYQVFACRALGGVELKFPMRLMLAAGAYFVMNTLPVAMAIHLTESKPLVQTWRNTYFWAFAYYLVGAAIAGALNASNSLLGWQTSILILPVTYVVYRSYHLYLNKLESQRAHAEEMAALHLRTIEALALAIEAKDQTTHDHLRRVQVYSLEIGRALGLSEEELQALLAASLLHDIGKLAVPEHIISKPGKLTAEEFEKMKIHPVVGAEILERVQFPYPVVPIVRHHHEKWDGTGYPDGIKGEEIPIGARILSAVDCLDAISSDRQYRRALPIDKAMEVVAGQSGISYDPR
ncbi:MAG: HD domain-containing protein, partial [Acidobacteria bacterium]|nr:HD domain-containing protein [Acidobacteriota bacterium]